MNSRAPRLLLIDDDPLFGRLLSRVAVAGNIKLVQTKSLTIRETAKIRDNYDLIIADYDLEHMSGPQLIRGLESRGESLPTILVSAYGHIPSEQFPPSILLSLHKSVGPQHILTSAVSVFKGVLRP